MVPAFVAALSGCVQRAPQTTPSSPTALPAPTASHAPAPPAKRAPAVHGVAPAHAAATVGPAASATAAAAAAVPSASVAPGAGGAQIYALSASPSVVHSGESVSFDVRTSANVASVTGTVSAYTLQFTRTSPGRFALAFAIPPNVPGLFHGTYAMNVVARSPDGGSAARSVSITFQ